MTDCIFCKIANGEIPSEKVYEDEKIVAFKDINPMAPVHILLIPRAHVASIAELDESSSAVIPDIMLAAKRIAAENHLDNGFRVVSNAGDDAGQTVHHLHFHLLGGKKLKVEMC